METAQTSAQTALPLPTTQKALALPITQKALALPTMPNIKTLAQKYKTPFFVYDFNAIKARLETFKDAFAGRKSLICYAVKANSNLALLRFLAQNGAGADCVSMGEVKRALAAGVPSYKIIYSGVGKSDEEIRFALDAEILFINVESFAELKRVEKIAESTGKVARISVRVNPNIDAKTHPYISTGLHENKFGVDIDTAKQIYIHAKNSEHLNAVGIHFHIGSQLTDLSPIKQAAEKIAELAHSLLALRLDLKFFDIGGGIGIRYTDEETIAPRDYAQAILAAMRGLDMTIVCEPGRFIVGADGYLVSRVLYEKKNGERRFVIVDAAMNDLMRPSLYGATHQVFAEVSGETNPANNSAANIVGPICESGDFLAKNVLLGECQSGQILAFGNAGAYGASMSSNYNTRPRALEVGVYDGADFVIKHAENLDAMLSDEVAILQGGLPWEK